ncbi:MAG TPA: hypothetical protein VJ914_05395 [Pseudonocardiaceae bacterium]|nr:hypothetical protein [Pseudonocardiaceae bacterium]
MNTERSSLANAYREQLAREAIGVGELTRQADEDRVLRICFPAAPLPAPGFISAAERAGLAADIGTVYRLLTELPERLYGGDAGALADAVGLTGGQARLVGRATAGPLLRLARADLHHCADGFKLLELNISSALGGVEIALLNQAMLGHPALARFTAERGLGHVDTVRHIAAMVRAQCGRLPGRPVVALAVWPGEYTALQVWMHIYADLLDDLGIDAMPCHVGELVERGARLEVQGRPLDAVLRLFLIDEVRTRRDEVVLEPLLRAVESGAVQLIGRLDGELYGNKGALALLLDDRFRSACDAGERACLDRFLPWTRPVRSKVRLPDGSLGDLESYARAEQHDLILKPVLSHSGVGIVAGWTVPPEQWQDQVRQALDGPYVLQRRVKPLPEVFPGPDGDQEFYLNWGVFVTDPSATGSDGYGGCYLRATGDPEAGAVYEANAAKIGCVFHEEAAPGDGGLAQSARW